MDRQRSPCCRLANVTVQTVAGTRRSRAVCCSRWDLSSDHHQKSQHPHTCRVPHMNSTIYLVPWCRWRLGGIGCHGRRRKDGQTAHLVRVRLVNSAIDPDLRRLVELFGLASLTVRPASWVRHTSTWRRAAAIDAGQCSVCVHSIHWPPRGAVLPLVEGCITLLSQMHGAVVT